MTVRRLGAGGWLLLRELRLAALRDAPHAFASRYEWEREEPDTSWQERAAAFAWFVAQEAEDGRASQRALASEERSRSGSRPFEAQEAEDGRASQRALASEERSRSGSRPFEAQEAEDGRASQRALASEERSRSGSRPFEAQEAEDGRASQRALASEERSRSGSRPFEAQEGDRAVGLVAGAAKAGTARHVVSMWVHPEHRRRGVGQALIDAVAGWAVADGGTVLRLWVADGNDAAARCYAASGFVPTGRRQPLPSDPAVGEELWELNLAPGTARGAPPDGRPCPPADHGG